MHSPSSAYFEYSLLAWKRREARRYRKPLTTDRESGESTIIPLYQSLGEATSSHSPSPRAGVTTVSTG